MLHILINFTINENIYLWIKLAVQYIRLRRISTSEVSYSAVVLYSRGQYEIIGLLKISHSTKHPCSSFCLEKY